MPAPSRRIVEGGLDAEAGERAGAEVARRPVDGIGDQDMVAAAQQCQQGRGDRGLAGADHDRAVAAFELGHRLLEGGGGGRAVAAIVGALVRTGRLQGRDGGEQDRRGVVDGRVDHAVLALGVAARDRDQGGVVHGVPLHCRRREPLAPRARFWRLAAVDRRVTVPRSAGGRPAARARRRHESGMPSKNGQEDCTCEFRLCFWRAWRPPRLVAVQEAQAGATLDDVKSQGLRPVRRERLGPAGLRRGRRQQQLVRPRHRPLPGRRRRRCSATRPRSSTRRSPPRSASPRCSRARSTSCRATPPGPARATARSASTSPASTTMTARASWPRRRSA